MDWKLNADVAITCDVQSFEASEQLWITSINELFSKATSRTISDQLACRQRRCAFRRTSMSISVRARHLLYYCYQSEAFRYVQIFSFVVNRQPLKSAVSFSLILITVSGIVLLSLLGIRNVGWSNCYITRHIFNARTADRIIRHMQDSVCWRRPMSIMKSTAPGNVDKHSGTLQKIIVCVVFTVRY